MTQQASRVPRIVVMLALAATIGGGLAYMYRAGGKDSHVHKDNPAGPASASATGTLLSTQSGNAARRQLPPEPPSEAEQRRSLENRFTAEPVSSSWARFNEHQVNAVLDDTQLLREGLEPPLAKSVECRQTLCRINLQVTEDPASEVTATHLLQQISGSLNSAQMFHEPRPDGTVEMVIYASYQASPKKPAASGRS